MMTQFDANFRKFTAQNGRAFVLLSGGKFWGGLGERVTKGKEESRVMLSV